VGRAAPGVLTDHPRPTILPRTRAGVFSARGARHTDVYAGRPGSRCDPPTTGVGVFRFLSVVTASVYLMSESKNWYDDHSNIASVASYLVHTELADVTELLEFIEKPWHFEEAWQRYSSLRDAERAADDDAREITRLRMDARRLGSDAQV
jgi:hypothetical protein